ncbi:MAG: chromosomal replication initiator protein DnaA [Patescibacteria group bacterium]
MEHNEVWKVALGEIELQISRPNFLTWFRNTSLLGKKEGIAVVALPNTFAKEWVENKYGKIVLRALRGIDETTKRVDYVVNGDYKMPAVKEKPSVNVRLASSEQLGFPEFKIDPETNLNPRYGFNTFVVGKSNELAYTACMAIADVVGSKYNPLFIYGGVGVGKTHLIQAVGNEIKNRYQNQIKVKYVPSEKFTNDVIAGIRTKRMEAVKEKYRLIDVLIVDDIQFITGKGTTEEEFFHTFNALYENNKQIIISSDRPPNFTPTLHERLKSRFAGGMTIGIDYPDYELRMAVLKGKVQEKRYSLDESYLKIIAAKANKNLRELEGLLNQIIFYQQNKGELNNKVVEQLINQNLQEPSRNANPTEIINCVAEFYDIAPIDLMGRCRKKELVAPRQIAMYLLRDVLSLSYPAIGEKLGKRDHTTAIYACEKVGESINKNHKLNQDILMIKDMVSKS